MGSGIISQPHEVTVPQPLQYPGACHCYNSQFELFDVT